MNKPNPPKLFLRFFRWFCHPRLRKPIEGDLMELYDERVKENGKKKADRKFIWDVIKLFRRDIIRPAGGTYRLNTYGMVKNYFKVGIRNILKYKVFSAINITGLAISMSVGLLVISFITEMYSYDSFHEKKDRIYRLVNNYSSPAYSTNYASVPLRAGQILDQEYSESAKVVYFNSRLRGDLVVKENQVVPIERGKGLYASDHFFKVFSFDLLEGNRATALAEPYSIVLSSSMANKLFDKNSAVGSTITLHDKPFKVTGVVADPPVNSHIRFDVLVSFSTLEIANQDNEGFYGWSNFWDNYIYLLLEEESNPAWLSEAARRISHQENAAVDGFEIHLETQALNDIFPNEMRYNPIGVHMEVSTIQWFAVLALVVILSACFNYANLSAAHSIKRAKEVGIRKVIGATKRQLIIQFVSEAVMISFISLLFAIMIFSIIRSEFLSLNENINQTTLLELNTKVLMYFALLSMVVGIAAGLFPALLMSLNRTLSNLKNDILKGGSKFGFKEVMTGVQFAVSSAFILIVLFTYKHYQFALNFELGFDTEHILNVEGQKNDLEILEVKFAGIPEVVSTSKSYYLPATGVIFGGYGGFQDPLDSGFVSSLFIDEKHISNFNHEIIAGDNFKASSGTPSVIVNEEFVSRFNGGDLGNVIGEKMSLNGDEYAIAGVVKNFHYGTIANDIGPFAFIQSEDLTHLNLKIQSTNITATIAKLEEAWGEVDGIHPFKASFYEDQISDAYNRLLADVKSLGLLSIIAASISLLGLFGISLFNAELKLKELSIRKVLGATFLNLVSRLSYRFLIIFIFGLAAGVPVALHVFEKYIVQNAVHTSPINYLEISLWILLIVGVSLVIVCSQTAKVALSNPAQNLHDE